MSKILFTYPSPFNPRYGGIETVTDALTRELQRRGHAVYYLHHRNPEFYEGFTPPAEVYYCPDSDYTKQEDREFYAGLLNRLEIDVVVNQTGNFGDSVLYNSCYPNIPVISVLHSNPLLNYDRLSSEILSLRNDSLVERCKFIVRCFLFPKIKSDYWKSRVEHLNWICANFSAVVLLSEGYRRALVRCGLSPEDLSVVSSIPNPCTYSRKRFSEKKKQLLFVGRLEMGEKRPDRLLKIWEMLYRDFPDWELIIVGDGKMKETLVKQSKKLPRVSFVGRQNPESYYEQASIFCMTSNFEGFPMVLPEAMAFGAIPVAFDSFAAVHDIISDGESGCMVKPFDLSEYAGVLRRLMSNDEVRRCMIPEVQRVADSFSINSIADRWEELLYKVKGGRNG